MAANHKRIVLTIQQKLDIVQNIEQGFTVREMCVQYNIGNSTVGNILGSLKISTKLKNKIRS